MGTAAIIEKLKVRRVCCVCAAALCVPYRLVHGVRQICSLWFAIALAVAHRSIECRLPWSAFDRLAHRLVFLRCLDTQGCGQVAHNVVRAPWIARAPRPSPPSRSARTTSPTAGHPSSNKRAHSNPSGAHRHGEEIASDPRLRRRARRSPYAVPCGHRSRSTSKGRRRRPRCASL